MEEIRGRLVNVIRPYVFANHSLLKLGSYSPTETRTEEFRSS